jgi:hypothetical protein
MMTNYFISIICFVFFIPSIIFASFGGSIYTGNPSYAIGYYSNDFDFDIAISSQINDDPSVSGVVTFAFQGNFKYSLSNKDFYKTILGVSGQLATGKISGVPIDSAYAIALMAGIEVKINSKVFLRGIVYPVRVSSITINSVTLNTLESSATGIIGLTYLF